MASTLWRAPIARVCVLFGVQEAALGALVAFGKLDLAYTLRSAAEAKTKHRVTEFVDRLVKALEA